MSPAERAQQTEQILSAAGFQRRPADTPDTQAQLARLPAHELFAEPRQSGTSIEYVYADPDQCRCLFVGDENAYQAYQRLSVEKRIADEHLRAAQLEENATLYAGPWRWGPGPWGAW